MKDGNVAAWGRRGKSRWPARRPGGAAGRKGREAAAWGRREEERDAGGGLGRCRDEGATRGGTGLREGGSGGLHHFTD
jgi:hypothetical protein